jgi:hypothetical protein
MTITPIEKLTQQYQDTKGGSQDDRLLRKRQYYSVREFCLQCNILNVVDIETMEYDIDNPVKDLLVSVEKPIDVIEDKLQTRITDKEEVLELLKNSTDIKKTLYQIVDNTAGTVFKDKDFKSYLALTYKKEFEEMLNEMGF